MKRTLALCSLGILSLLGCADDAAIDEDAVDELAETTFPDDPLPADMVDWKIAGQAPSLEQRSNYFRAQSLMSSLAVQMYVDEPSATDYLKKTLGFIPSITIDDQVGGINKPRMHAMFGSVAHAKMTWLAIRGSDNISDYVNDLLIAPTDVGDGSGHLGVHRGFAKYADTVYDKLRPQLDAVCSPKFGDNQRPLWITGHSLGGAVATILAQRFAQDGCYVAGVVTIGSPRPGLVSFQQAYNRITTKAGKLGDLTSRWTRDKDPVPCTAPGGAWKHVGRHNTIEGTNTLKLNVGGSDKCDDPDGWLGNLKKSVTGLTYADPSMALTKGQLALQDWINNKIILEWICTGGKWVDVVSLGGCTLVEKTTRLVEAYQGLVFPQELVLSAIALGVNDKFHSESSYRDHLGADFEIRYAKNVSDVVIRIPRANALQAPVIREDITGQVCHADSDPQGNNWLCSFRVVTDKTANYRIGVDRAATASIQVPQCDGGKWTNDHEYNCPKKRNKSETIAFNPYL